MTRLEILEKQLEDTTQGIKDEIAKAKAEDRQAFIGGLCYVSAELSKDIETERRKQSK